MAKNKNQHYSLWSLLLLISLISLTFVLSCFLQIDMDIWWHLKAAELIRESGIPQVDSWTFTAAGNPWIDLHWIFQLTASWIYNRAGMEGLTLAAALAVCLTVLMILMARNKEWSFALSVACWTPCVFLLSSRAYVRPEMFSLFLLACYLTVLFHGVNKPRLLWILPLLQILWVNVQGLFILGPIVFSFFLLERMAHWARDTKSVPFATYLSVGVAIGIACVLNPYGVRGALFPLELFQKMSTDSEFYSQTISELNSIQQVIAKVGFMNPYVLIHMSILGLGALSFLFVWSRKRFSLFRLLAFGAFAWLSLQATRNSGQFALVCGAVLNWNFCEWYSVGKRKSDPGPLLVLKLGLVGGLAGLVAFVVTGNWYAVAGEGRIWGLGEHPNWHAHKAAQFITQPSMPKRILAIHLGQAGLIEFYTNHNQQLFCDPRLEVVGRETLQDYTQIREALGSNSARGTNLLAQQGIDAVLLDHRSSGESTLLSDPDWKCVYFDSIAGVYLPTDRVEEAGVAPFDFAQLYFESSQSDISLSTKRSARPLIDIGRSLQQLPHDDAVRRSILLTAHRFIGKPTTAEEWSLRAIASFHLATPMQFQDSTATEWHPYQIVNSAQCRYGLRKSVALKPLQLVPLGYVFSCAADQNDVGTLLDLKTKFPLIKTDSELTTQNKSQMQAMLKERLSETDTSTTFPEEIENLEQLNQLTSQCFELGRYDTIISLFRQFGENVKVPCKLADRLALSWLTTGYPERARAVWRENVTESQESAMVLARIGLTFLVEFRFDDARKSYLAALRRQPEDLAALWGITRTSLEQGDASQTYREATRALSIPVMTPGFEEEFRWMRDFGLRGMED